MKEPDVLGHESNTDRESGGHRGPRETLLGLLFIAWSGFVVWHYASTVLKVRSVPEFLGLTLLATALVVGVPGALLAHLERRRGRRMARSALLALGGMLAAYLVVASGVAGAAAATLFLLAAAYGYGAAVTGWAGLDDEERGWQGVPMALTVGLAVLVILAIVAGTAGALTRPVTAAVGAVGVILAGLRLRWLTTGRRAAPAPSVEPVGIQWWWGWVVLVLIGLVGAVAPEIRADALAAHLPIAREFAVRGAIVEMRQNIGSYLTLNGTILYALGMTLVAGEAVPKLLHFAAGVLSSLLAYGLGARFWQPRVGLAAAAVVASTPLMWWVGGTAYTDLWHVLFATGAVAVLARYRDRPGVGPAVTLGVLAGAAVGARLTSLVVALPVAVFAILFVKVRHDGASDRVPAAAAFILGAALSGAYWYVRSWVLTGNPVFPMLNAVFKSPLWAIENTRFNMHLFGMGAGLADLLAVPWRVTFFPGRFVEEGSLGPAYLALLPAVVLAAVRGRIPRWLLGISGAAVLVWFFGAQYLRYLLPVIPVLAVIGAAGLMAGSTLTRPLGAAGGALILSVTVAAAGWMSSGQASFPLGVAVGKVPRADHASTYVAGFHVAQYVRRALPSSARIYGMGEDMMFYYDRYFVPSAWLGHVFNPGLPQKILSARTGSEVQRVLTQAGFTHLVLQRNHPWVTRWRRPDGWLASEVLWEEEGPRIEYAYLEFYLFRLVSSSVDVPMRRGPELLQNPGLEPGAGPIPHGWDIQGSVNVVTSDDGSGGREIRVRASPGSYLVQRVVVTPNHLYGLEAGIRSVGASSTVRLSITWIDGGGKVLDYRTFRQVAAGPEWRRYAMASTAPAEARSAQIWLIAAEGGDVEFGQAAFRELR